MYSGNGHYSSYYPAMNPDPYSGSRGPAPTGGDNTFRPYAAPTRRPEPAHSQQPYDMPPAYQPTGGYRSMPHMPVYQPSHSASSSQRYPNSSNPHRSDPYRFFPSSSSGSSSQRPPNSASASSSSHRSGSGHASYTSGGSSGSHGNARSSHSERSSSRTDRHSVSSTTGHETCNEEEQIAKLQKDIEEDEAKILKWDEEKRALDQKQLAARCRINAARDKITTLARQKVQREKQQLHQQPQHPQPQRQNVPSSSVSNVTIQAPNPSLVTVTVMPQPAPQPVVIAPAISQYQHQPPAVVVQTSADPRDPRDPRRYAQVVTTAAAASAPSRCVPILPAPPVPVPDLIRFPKLTLRYNVAGDLLKSQFFTPVPSGTIKIQFRITTKPQNERVLLRICNFDQSKPEQMDHINCRLNITINSVMVFVGKKAPHRGPLDITSKVFEGDNVIEIKEAVPPLGAVNEPLPTRCGITVIKAYKIEAEATLRLLEKDDRYCRQKDNTLDQIRSKFVSSEADSLLTDVIISLICPLTKTRLQLPCFGAKCQHLIFFDGRSFVEMNQNRDEWSCPHCRNTIGMDELRIDGLIREIMSECKPSVTQIAFDKNGVWKPVEEAAAPPKAEKAAAQRIDICDDIITLDSDDDEPPSTSNQLPRGETTDRSTPPDTAADNNSDSDEIVVRRRKSPEKNKKRRLQESDDSDQTKDSDEESDTDSDSSDMSISSISSSSSEENRQPSRKRGRPPGKKNSSKQLKQTSKQKAKPGPKSKTQQKKKKK